MSTLQQFHRFRDLPRELQLHIWECYERTQPHHQHYFRKMMVWAGRLYAGSDQHTDQRISNIANADDPDQTQVPDAAVAPQTKIQLPRMGNWDPHWVSQDEFITVATFRSIQVPRSMTMPVYIWVNFKTDTFCFARNPDEDSNRNFLQYLQDANGLVPLTSASQSPIMSHWFFRIQRLVLIKTTANQPLGPLDRQLLGVHPSLRTLTIVSDLDVFRCSHLGSELRSAPGTLRAVERLPLTTFLALRQTETASCSCDRPMRRLAELEQLRQDLVDLFQGRSNTAPHVDVDIEVEVFWAPRMEADDLVTDTESP